MTDEGNSTMNIHIFMLLFFFLLSILIICFSRHIPPLLESIRKSTWNHPALIAIGLFFIALIVRSVFFWSKNDEILSYFIVKGVPFSDAHDWNERAISLYEGRGLPGEGGAIRPFFPIVLACVYIWFKPSFVVAQSLNMLASALTVPFIYLIGEKVFNRLIGFIAAWLALGGLRHLFFSITIMSEPLGLLFFVISVYYLLKGIQENKITDVFVCGVFLGLSNLTRTLTIISLAGYMVCIIYFIQPKKNNYRKGIKWVSVLMLGTVISLLPWLIRQKMVYGIYTLSINTAASFYAATSPKLKTWSGLVDQELNQKGITDVKERYHYFTKKTVENLRNYPLFYLTNCSQVFFNFLNSLHYNLKEGFILYSFIGFVLIITLVFIGKYPYLDWQHRGYLLAIGYGISILMILFIYFHVSFLIIIMAMIVAFNLKEYKLSFIISTSLICSGIGFAMVGGGPLDRIVLMVEWMFHLFYLFFLYATYDYVVNRVFLTQVGPKPIIKNHMRLSSESFTHHISKKIDHYFSKIQRYGISLLMLFFGISGCVLIYRNVLAYPEVIPYDNSISFEQKNEIMRKLNELLPEPFHETEFDNVNAFAQSVDDSNIKTQQGKIVIEKGRISPYIYPLTSDEGNPQAISLFQPRFYTRTVMEIIPLKYVVFPGVIPTDYIGKEFVFIGRQQINEKDFYQGRVIVELIAMISINQQQEYQDILFGKNPYHWELLNSLKIQAIQEHQ